MSAASTAGDRAQLARLYGAALRNVALLMLPACVVAALAAPWVLGWWMGPAHAAASSNAMRVLAVGVFINGLAHVPSAYLQAVGRPDVNARFHAAELLVHVPVTLGLVHLWGITGAAAAWSVRASVDAVLLFVATHRIVGLSPRLAVQGRGPASLLAAGTLAAAAVIAVALGAAHSAGLMAAAIGVAAYGAVAWRSVVSADERRLVRALIRARAGAGAVADPRSPG